MNPQQSVSVQAPDAPISGSQLQRGAVVDLAGGVRRHFYFIDVATQDGVGGTSDDLQFDRRRRKYRRRTVSDMPDDSDSDYPDYEDETPMPRRRRNVTFDWSAWILWFVKSLAFSIVVAFGVVGIGYSTGNFRGKADQTPMPVTNSSTNNTSITRGPNHSRDFLIDLLNTSDRFGLSRDRQKQAIQAVEKDSK